MVDSLKLVWRPTVIIIITAMTVIAANSIHVYLIENHARDVSMYPRCVTQCILHRISFRGAPFDDKNIRIYKVRSRANIDSSSDRWKIDNNVVVSDLKRVEQ